MNYKSFDLGDWIGHISGVIEDESELDGNEMRDLVEFLSGLPKWIPVSERLPKWDVECLVVDDKGEFGVGFYRDDVGAWDSPSWGWLERKDEVDNHDAYYMPCGIGKVIAWIPLPKPYKAESEGMNEMSKL